MDKQTNIKLLQNVIYIEQEGKEWISMDGGETWRLLLFVEKESETNEQSNG